jgi:hypothetical protein
MNKKLPAYMPLALVLVAGAVAASLIVSNATMPAPTVATIAPSHADAADGTVTVAPAAGQTASAAASVSVGQVQRITWNKGAYPSATVNVSIIKKTGDNPARYSLVRNLGAISNTGSATWTPAAGETGTDIYVEVGCTSTASACRANITKIN